MNELRERISNFDEAYRHIMGYCYPGEENHDKCWYADNIASKNLGSEEEHRLQLEAIKSAILQALPEERKLNTKDMYHSTPNEHREDGYSLAIKDVKQILLDAKGGK